MGAPGQPCVVTDSAAGGLMATLFKEDGTMVEVKPAHGRQFTLKELRGLVGGPLEAIPEIIEGSRVYCNQEALLMRLRLNTRASERFGSRVFGGRVLGPVIELTPEEAREDLCAYCGSNVDEGKRYCSSECEADAERDS
jgi:hypothetical protein